MTTISFWVFAAGLVLGGYVLARDMLPRFGESGAAMAAAAPIIVLAAAAVAVIIWALDRSDAQVRSAWALAFAWGAIGACGLALQINGFASDAVSDVLDDPGATYWGAALVGPLNEETIKGAGVALLLVIFRDRLRRPLQIFAVGAFAGLGFQVVENLSYAITFALRDAQSDVAGALTVTLLRALFGFQSHWVYTGFFALGLALLRSRPALAVLAVALSYLLHFWWNAPGGDDPMLAFALILLKCAVTLTLLGAAWWWMILDQRRWLQGAIGTPEAAALAPPAELATLPTRALRRAGQEYLRHYYGPAFADVARERQRWLIRELTQRLG
ncbi:PrsW family intramembrane metalloprotease [Tsukamurella asaccharolytica]|nr:PrsW family intramembrane metalloprotease [Tsukamurella asaccharolytica]